MRKAKIKYLHLEGLGGRRAPNKRIEKNLAWRNPQFRGYADYMQTKEFKQSLQELVNLARENVVAVMCAEAVPWRCHRSMIGDALLVRGFNVEDIFNASTIRPHRLTSFAKINRYRITYPLKKQLSDSVKPIRTEVTAQSHGGLKIQIKRVYEKPDKNDGYRVFVDRLWPRGRKKTEVPFDEWPKQISPSTGLCRSSRKIRKKFGYNLSRWKEFRSEYLRELRKHSAKQKLESLVKIAKGQNLTLLYSTNDKEYNNAAVLSQVITRKFRRLAKQANSGDHSNGT